MNWENVNHAFGKQRWGQLFQLAIALWVIFLIYLFEGNSELAVICFGVSIILAGSIIVSFRLIQSKRAFQQGLNAEHSNTDKSDHKPN